MNPGRLSLLKNGSVKSDRIQLDKNENPFPLPPSPREELRQVLSDVALNRYPDPEARGLKASLSGYCGFPAENIIVGNGGDEILYFLFMALVAQGGRALTLEPTFSEYYHLFDVFNVQHRKVFLQENGDRFSADREALLDAIAAFSPHLTMIDCPNNPTGMTLSPDFLEEIIELTPGVTLIDEAYAEFSDTSILDRYRGGDLPEGTVVLRTLSKAWGLAGLRVGYAVCDPATRARLEKVRPPYNVNSLSQAAARTVLGYREWMESRVYSLRYIRDNFVQQVNRLPGWTAFSSQSNFVLLKGPSRSEQLTEVFRENRIDVKRVNGLSADATYLRVSVGREEEMTTLLRAIQTCAEAENLQFGEAREA